MKVSQKGKNTSYQNSKGPSMRKSYSKRIWILSTCLLIQLLLPSGKFATNALVLGLSVLVYNILRWIGQNGLPGLKSPKRSKAQRRRIRTVMQELMYVAARIIKTTRTIKISFGRSCRSLLAFDAVYRKLAYGQVYWLIVDKPCSMGVVRLKSVGVSFLRQPR